MWEAVDDASVVPEELSEARSSWMDLLDGPRVLKNEVREEGPEESVELFSGDRLFSEKPIEESLDLLGEWNDNHPGAERFGGSVWRRFKKPRRRRKRRCRARWVRDCGLCCRRGCRFRRRLCWRHVRRRHHSMSGCDVRHHSMSGCDVQRQSTSGCNDALEGGLLLSLRTASKRLTETIEVNTWRL